MFGNTTNDVSKCVKYNKTAPTKCISETTDKTTKNHGTSKTHDEKNCYYMVIEPICLLIQCINIRALQPVCERTEKIYRKIPQQERPMA
mmetsp:Transcript_133/g.288  ORF Transcript_133/g.288 Transcript_133/m.288 type:complete len:89 (+) Transcript_133:1462-1728(+)